MIKCITLCFLVATTPSGNQYTLYENLSVWECHQKFLRENNAVVDVLEVHPELVPPKFECLEMYP